MNAPPPIPQSLLDLAPLHLSNRRASRYAGDDHFIALEELASQDCETLVRLYRVFSELLYRIVDPTFDDAARWREIGAWIERHDLSTVTDDARSLGAASHRLRPSEQLAKAMHDVRGGALGALIGRLDLLDHTSYDESNLNTIFVLVRDHLKIMRNAVVGLDPKRREADRLPKTHAMSLMLEKWHQSITGPNWRNRPIRMAVDCRYQGGLTECCLESAAIDRIFYNLANNACRHAAGGRLDMAVFPIPEAPGECLRFVLSNQVEASAVAYFKTLPASSGTPDLSPLFDPEVSSTGSGFGLTVVADFVAGAFGLQSRQEALQAGYVGARLDGDTFRAWFHWPMAMEHPTQKLDDFRRPDESLSEG